MNDNGGPAFPVPMFAVGHAKYEAKQQGLTLRDYFAAKAMQALVSRPNFENTFNATLKAKVAYAVADEMLKARQS